MNAEVLLAAGYAALLVAGAFLLEWLSAHTHRRALRYRTAGFTYDEDARPLALPGRRAALAARVRPRAPARPLPRPRARLQRLPEQGALHRLRPGPRDRPAARPLAALRGRPLPPRHRAPHGRPRSLRPRDRAGAAPQAPRGRAPSRTSPRDRARRTLAPPRPARPPGQLSRRDCLARTPYTNRAT